ncbi:hypothetical protein BN7_4052 [Wickerhamomyces ciferrii]|uniref:Uncharacterized protein n=1 Tax=Wickerhamomyces ciferrii (strain ATCC 14091 / BCRC 22168 / CBS 111 / JCM 3599 / NBRC 0793 / NRRL Y-1031 F-60-10) TaxID=1206466 RepID=K0KT47_WICCF|nr:uncharacterized protein BN7_4052 [Wickerhamomyces ciferrii]CCH44488.1 hypothetical protein BN7_4052 [Wickerhamomyces ciferrii]
MLLQVGVFHDIEIVKSLEEDIRCFIDGVDFSRSFYPSTFRVDELKSEISSMILDCFDTDLSGECTNFIEQIVSDRIDLYLDSIFPAEPLVDLENIENITLLFKNSKHLAKTKRASSSETIKKIKPGILKTINELDVFYNSIERVLFKHEKYLEVFMLPKSDQIEIIERIIKDTLLAHENYDKCHLIPYVHIYSVIFIEDNISELSR